MLLSKALHWALGLIAVISAAVAAILSFVVSFRLLGHSLTIHSMRLHYFTISFFGLKYSYKSRFSSYSISTPHLQLALHRPRISKPTIFTLTLYHCDFADTQHHASLSKLHVVVSVSPVLTRISAGPFISVTLDDFRTLVFTSQCTPEWIQKLRENLIYTILNGDTFRLDDLDSRIILNTCGGRTVTEDDNDEVRRVTDLPNSYEDHSTSDENTYDITIDDGSYDSDTSDAEYKPIQGLTDSEEQAIITLTSSQWHIKNFASRIYEFGSISAQLRRSWDTDKGTFVLIAKNCQWKQAPRTTRSCPDGPNVRWRDILWNILMSPYLLSIVLFCTIRDPASLIDLYVPRMDVTFDQFRLQDAELVKQAWGWARREYVVHDGGDIMRDMIWDALGAFLR